MWCEFVRKWSLPTSTSIGLVYSFSAGYMVLYYTVTNLWLRKPLHYLRKIRISSSCSSRQDVKLDKSASRFPRYILFFRRQILTCLNNNKGALGNEWGRDWRISPEKNVHRNLCAKQIDLILIIYFRKFTYFQRDSNILSSSSVSSQKWLFENVPLFWNIFLYTSTIILISSVQKLTSDSVAAWRHVNSKGCDLYTARILL